MYNNINRIDDLQDIFEAIEKGIDSTFNYQQQINTINNNENININTNTNINTNVNDNEQQQYLNE